MREKEKQILLKHMEWDQEVEDGSSVSFSIYALLFVYSH